MWLSVVLDKDLSLSEKYVKFESVNMVSVILRWEKFGGGFCLGVHALNVK